MLVLVVDLVVDETAEVPGRPSSPASALLAPFIPIVTLAVDGISGHPRSMFGGAYVVDDFALVLKALFLGIGYVVLLMSTNYIEEGDYYEGEYYFLILSLAARHGGHGVGPRPHHHLHRPRAAVDPRPTCWPAGASATCKCNEASLKYYLLGVLASAVMLYGMSLIFGGDGHDPADRHRDQKLTVAPRPASRSSPSASSSSIVGFAFKVSAVPFHFWAPDTYEGAPTPVTAFLSVASKTAGFVALLELVFVGFFGRHDVWQPLFWVLAALTMTVGNLIALRQTNIVRMLAYSSIAQAGYILVPFAVAGDQRRQAPARRPHRQHRLPADLRGHEPRRLRRRHRGGPQDPLGRDHLATAACSTTPRA